jgi:exosortase/archaeosortase family protein
MKKEFIKVCLLFAGLVVLSDYLIWFLGRNEYLAFFDIFHAVVITKLIHLSGLEATRDSNVIYLANTTWLVAIECTAIFIMAIFASFVVVYPSTFRAKGIAILAGIPFIFVVNIFRLYIMAWIDKLRPEFSEYFHNYAWQVLFIIMVVFMWIIWIERVVNTAEHEDRQSSAAG